MIQLIFVIRLSIATPQCLKAFLGERGNGLRSKTHEPVLFERSEFTGECAELLTESRELCTAARRCGCRAGTARLLFFCRRFLFQIKRKCRNAECIYHLIMVRSEGKSQLPTNHNCYGSVSAAPITDSRKGCPYGVRVNKIVQISRADSICPYPVLFHYSLLVITLSASETTSQPRLTPSQRPLQGRLIDSSTTLNLPIHSPIIFSIAFSNSSFCSGRRFCGPFILPPAMRIFFVS